MTGFSVLVCFSLNAGFRVRVIVSNILLTRTVAVLEAVQTEATRILKQYVLESLFEVMCYVCFAATVLLSFSQGNRGLSFVAIALAYFCFSETATESPRKEACRGKTIYSEIEKSCHLYFRELYIRQETITHKH